MTKPLDQPRPILRASVMAVPPRHRFTTCIGRLSAVVGTGRARCLWKVVAVCWANALPTIASEADRVLGPMLPASAWERWPFCVVRESCHAAVPDQPGLPSIGSGRRTGGSRRHPRLPSRLFGVLSNTGIIWPRCVFFKSIHRDNTQWRSRVCSVPGHSRTWELQGVRAVRLLLKS